MKRYILFSFFMLLFLSIVATITATASSPITSVKLPIPEKETLQQNLEKAESFGDAQAINYYQQQIGLSEEFTENQNTLQKTDATASKSLYDTLLVKQNIILHQVITNQRMDLLEKQKRESNQSDSDFESNYKKRKELLQSDYDFGKKAKEDINHSLDLQQNPSNNLTGNFIYEKDPVRNPIAQETRYYYMAASEYYYASRDLEEEDTLNIKAQLSPSDNRNQPINSKFPTATDFHKASQRRQRAAEGFEKAFNASQTSRDEAIFFVNDAIREDKKACQKEKGIWAKDQQQ